MIDIRKKLNELAARQNKSDEVRVDAYTLDEWKENMARFLRFEPETDAYIPDSFGMLIPLPAENREYDAMFALCCDRFVRFEEMKSPENRAGQLFDVCYGRNGVEDTLRRAMVFADKIRPESDAAQAAQTFYDHHICPLALITQRAAQAYDTWPFDYRAYDMGPQAVLQFIRAEAQEDPCICNLPRAWDTVCSLEGKSKTDAKTWSWLSGAMEEFGSRGRDTQHLAQMIARIEELSQKRVRIIEQGEKLRSFFKTALTPEYFEQFNPDIHPVTMDAEQFSAHIRREMEALWAAYHAACI